MSCSYSHLCKFKVFKNEDRHMLTDHHSHSNECPKPIDMSDTPTKVIPRSPYVEEETDEEFRPEKHDSDIDGDERICRICFSGQDEVDTLGKLISPCKCRYLLFSSVYNFISLVER